MHGDTAGPRLVPERATVVCTHAGKACPRLADARVSRACPQLHASAQLASPMYPSHRNTPPVFFHACSCPRRMIRFAVTIALRTSRWAARAARRPVVHDVDEIGCNIRQLTQIHAM
ncbi:hypothetical protein ZWY2020_036033 [Hordeum vulgare]|nr:hypothetical protein ZWY2020_059558 [Hordeum vulgare]KAI4988716.1 hypothetical protein ZWY2020_036033 [Hordeum vulgare]